ncbi:hypothetical protein Vretimale_3064 [Volvox reticuliferus]|uniref:Uncharacterized protein n=1 Tax=Volvox reticuliferus TaxID=1737510 RepID=A0A8J4FZX0_9CHLO|nr:hypothetical protein Vretimale_3064 [Volvox reticuliferus]
MDGWMDTMDTMDTMEVFRSAASTWSRLDTQQRVYTVIAGAALLIATPQLLTFLLITVERLLVGALLAVEEVLAGVLLLGTRLVRLRLACCNVSLVVARWGLGNA